MVTSTKRKHLPVFKIGEKVCFLLQKGNNLVDKTWHMGEITGFPTMKPHEDPMVDVRIYEIPEHFISKKQQDTQDEWSSLDPVPFDLPSEVIILSLLDSRTNVIEQTNIQRVRVSLQSLCKATVNDFRTALEQCPLYPLGGKQTFW